MKKKLRATVASTIAAIGLLAAAIPAGAADAVMLDSRSGSNGNNTVTSRCVGGPGVATDFNRTTHVVEADTTAVSLATKSTRPADEAAPAVPVAAAVQCVVKGTNGVVYGRVSSGLPGATTVAVDTVTIPRGVIVYVEVCGSAIFSDGRNVTTC